MHILSVVVARPFLTALVLNETWIVHVAEQQTSKYAGYRTNEPVVEPLLQTLVTAGLVRASYPRPCSSARITSLFVVTLVCSTQGGPKVILFGLNIFSHHLFATCPSSSSTTPHQRHFCPDKRTAGPALQMRLLNVETVLIFEFPFFTTQTFFVFGGQQDTLDRNLLQPQTRGKPKNLHF